MKFSFGCKQDGSCSSSVLGNYDGKPYKDAAVAIWEASFRKTGDRTMQEDDYTSGKLSRTVRWQLSPDGSILTRTYHSHYRTPPGAKDISYTYDRSGGAVSNKDPFMGVWKHDWNKSDVLITTYAPKGESFTITTPDRSTVERNCDGEDHPTIIDPILLYSCRFNGP